MASVCGYLADKVSFPRSCVRRKVQVCSVCLLRSLCVASTICCFQSQGSLNIWWSRRGSGEVKVPGCRLASRVTKAAGLHQLAKKEKTMVLSDVWCTRFTLPKPMRRVNCRGGSGESREDIDHFGFEFFPIPRSHLL